MSLSIEEILANAELPEGAVTLCLRGSLVGRFEELQHRLQGASTKALSLGEPAEATSIARDMEDLRAQMQPYEVTFRLRALPPFAWEKFHGRLPEPGKTEADQATYDERFHAWVCELVSLVVYEPAMTAEQADELSQKLSGNQWKSLSDKAFVLNANRVDIPFSAAASELTRISGLELRRQEPGESPIAGSSAKSPAKPRRTNTTLKAV